MTCGPAARVAALVRLLRPAVDEIVVAIDDRAGPDVTAALVPVADRLVHYPYAEPVDRPLAWLHSECSGDWVLTLDDDEIPGQGLLDSLPQLVAATDVTHYWLPRRWLYPDSSRFIDRPPWCPDYQLRLVLNDPRLLSFPDEAHKPVAVLGPGRHLEFPLYHANCLLSSWEERRAKAQRYERSRPGKRIAGRPMNELYYVPETVEPLPTRLLPEADLALVRSVLEAETAPSAAGEAPALAAATRADIDRLWQGRALRPSAYRGRLELREDWLELSAGEVRAMDVRVQNLGDEAWPWGAAGRPEIRLAYRWRDGRGRVSVEDGLRTPFPADLAPGQSAVVPVQVEAPAAPGRYGLEIDLVHEHVRWFGCAVRVEVVVEGCRRVGLVGDDPGVIHAELARLAEVAPDLEPVVFMPRSEGLGPDLRVTTHPGLEAYLLDRLPKGRLAAARVALRTAALVRAARAPGAARDRLPAEARMFVEHLPRLEAVVVAAGNPPVRAAAVLAAEAAGVPTALVGETPRGRLVNRVLLGLAERRASERRAGLPALPGPAVEGEGRRPEAPTRPEERPEWELVPEGWARAAGDERLKGWNVDAIADAYRAKWPSFVRAVESGGTLGIYHEAAAGEEVPTDDHAAHNMVVTLGYVLALAAQGADRLSVLDWGGGSGHYFLLCETLLPGVELDYHVKDVPKLAALGRELVPEATFHDDDSCLERTYDVVLVSGALQYAEDWAATLARLGAAAGRYLFVTRLPVATTSQSFVVVQRAYAYGYDTEYLGWVLNRDELLERAAASGLSLVREFLLQAWFSAWRAPEDPVGHRGFLWAPARAGSRS